MCKLIKITSNKRHFKNNFTHEAYFEIGRYANKPKLSYLREGKSTNENENEKKILFDVHYD